MDAYKEKNKIKKTKVEKTVLWICFAIFFVYALTLIYPFFLDDDQCGKNQNGVFQKHHEFCG